MKNFVKLIVCTIVCIITVSGLVNAQNFTMNGAASPTATLTCSDPNDTICVGNAVSFTAGVQAGSTYEFLVNGTSMQGPGAGTIYIPAPPFTAGNQQVVLIVNNGICTDSDTINFVTMALPTPTLTTPDNSVCAGTSVTFTAGGGTNYNFKVNGISMQNGASNTYTTPTLLDGQVVTVDVTNSGGCMATSAGITMTIYPLPTATLTTPDNSVCAGTSVTFTAGGGTNYDFQINGTSVQNGALNTYTTSSLTDGQIANVVVTDGNGCSATSAGITMIIFPLPYATSVTGNVTPACVGSMANVTISGLVGTAPWTFEIWNTAGGVPTTLYYSVPGSSVTPNTTISVPVPAVGLTNMFLDVTDGNGCTNH